MNSLMPDIIDRVFDFLQVLDIYQCQFVCKLWRKIALRKLINCPPIDECELFVTGNAEYMGYTEFWKYMEYKQYMEHLEYLRFVEPDKVAEATDLELELEFSPTWDLDLEPSYNWYFERESDQRLLSKSGTDDAVQSFLTSDVRCIPSFSLVLYCEDFRYVLEKTGFKFPTILLAQEPAWGFSNQKTVKVELPSADEAQNSSSEIFHTTTTLLRAFHTSRYIPELKITITDWSDPESPRPTLNYTELPIKSIICFVAESHLTSTNDETLPDETEEMDKYFERFKSVRSGGVIPMEREDKPLICLYDPHKDETKASSMISITFAGRGIESVIYGIEQSTQFEAKLEEIMNSVPFPLDHRVFGFLFSRSGSYWISTGQPLTEISTLFSAISLIKIRVTKFPRSAGIHSADIVLHLIRFRFGRL